MGEAGEEGRAGGHQDSWRSTTAVRAGRGAGEGAEDTEGQPQGHRPTDEILRVSSD